MKASTAQGIHRTPCTVITIADLILATGQFEGATKNHLLSLRLERGSYVESGTELHSGSHRYPVLHVLSWSCARSVGFDSNSGNGKEVQIGRCNGKAQLNWL